MEQESANRQPGPGTILWPWPAFRVGVAVFLVGAFLYVWFRLEPVLEYHGYGPYFYRHRIFLETFLGRPGGLVSYAGVFLAQLNFLNWLGALVFVLLECLVLMASFFCLGRIGGRSPGLVAFVPAFVLLELRNRYGCPVPALSLGLLLALGGAAAQLWFPWRRPWPFVAVSGLFSGLLFLLGGLWSALVFAALCGLYVWIRMGHPRAGLGCLVLALAIPLPGVLARPYELGALVNPWGDGAQWYLAAALYASVPVAGAALAIFPHSLAAPLARSASRGGENMQPGFAAVVLMFLIGWAIVWLTYDRRQKLLAEIDYATSCGDYEAALEAASQVQGLNHPAKVRVQLALYHTGRLAEELFSFCSLIAETRSGIGEDCRAQCQPLLELGLVNDAEHMACEALVMEGERPDLLRLLARINQLKGRPQAAQVFLNVLSLIPFQGERANDSWPALEAPQPAAGRVTLLTNDVVHEGLPAGSLLEVLLAANPTNQMAFEYVMADALLDLNLKKAVEQLRLLDNFHYSGIPKSYEEALLLFAQRARVQIDLKGRTIRPETLQRYRLFKEAARRFQGTPRDLTAMAANFGDTYWYYYYAALGRERAVKDQPAAR